jgi:hypothetical protein
MDLKLLRERAIEETRRFFWDTQGFVPDEDSDEWEDEYRRRFDLEKARDGAKDAAELQTPATPTRAEVRQSEWPELSGAPAQKRWAMTLRSERLKDLQSPEVREWLAASWTTAKNWIDASDVPAAVFLRQVEAQYLEHQRQSERAAGAAESERQAKAAAGGAIQHQIKEAGITAQGLIDLVDVSPRTPAAPIRDKLAEIDAGGRTLRVFDTTNPAVLVVLEKGEAGRTDYAIERDAGLVADLKLFSRRPDSHS